MLLTALAAAISSVDGICFSSVIDSAPRSVIVALPLTTNASCQIECMKITNCDSVHYSDVTQTCFILGKVSSGATCGAPFPKQLKTNESCSKYNLTANYVPLDPCLASASMSPERLKYETAPACPNTPLDGEEYARVYVLSVIFPNGTYGVFDNNAQSGIIWNSTINSWIYTFQSAGKAFVYEPIYAASCAYYPNGVSVDCGCDPLPLETASAARPGAHTPVNSPTGACSAGFAGRGIQARSGQVDTCDPCLSYTISCIYKMWIIASSDGATTKTFQVTNATCYQPPQQ